MKSLFPDVLFRPAAANIGLIACGFASLALWLAALFMPEIAGPVLGSIMTKPTAVPDAGPTWLLLGAFVPYVGAYLFATRAPRRSDAAVIGVFAALFCVPLVARILPTGTYDLYLYVFQGRAAALHGLNPYLSVPSDVADPFVAAMGEWLSGLKNTYGPLWTSLATAIVASVGDRPAAQVVAFKVCAAAFFLASASLVARLGREVSDGGAVRSSGGPLVLFAWNPALLFEFVQNGHNDAAMVFFLLLALLLSLRGRFAWSGAALAASFLVKYVTVLCVPFFLAYVVSRAGAGFRARAYATLRFAAPLVLVMVAAYAPFWAGPATLDGLLAQSSLAGIDISSPLPFALAFAYAGGDHDRLLSQEVIDAVSGVSLYVFAFALATLVLAATVRVRSGRDLVRFAFAPLVCYLALACFWFMPWYLSWIVPLLVIEGAAVAAIALAATGLLLYYAYFTAPALGAAAVVIASAPIVGIYAKRRYADARRRVFGGP